MLLAIPGQLIFGRDMILNTSFIADWEAIRLRKQKIIDNKNQIENKNRKLHIYRIRDNVLVRNKNENNHEEPYIGPYPITRVWTNGNVTMRWGAVKEHIHTIWTKPYHK